MSERDPDAELVAGVGRQEPAAVRTLVARKLPRLLALAMRMLGDRMEAEDVAQEAFMRIWKQAPRWREGEARFDTWLHRVALNLCYDRLRAHREEPVDEWPDSVDPGPVPETQLEAQSRDARVRAALAALPARQRARAQLLPGTVEHRSGRADGRYRRSARKPRRPRWLSQAWPGSRSPRAGWWWSGAAFAGVGLIGGVAGAFAVSFFLVTGSPSPGPDSSYLTTGFGGTAADWSGE